MISFKYFLDKNAFSLGGSYQTNNALGKKVDEHPQNFIIGNGDFFYTLDAGYTRILSEKFSVEGELSFGKRKYYTNYNDDNAAQGAYHKIDKVKSIFGGGAMLFYNISETFVLFAGYNSIREGSFGLEVRFVKQNQY
jgi:hypothetical protein